MVRSDDEVMLVLSIFLLVDPQYVFLLHQVCPAVVDAPDPVQSFHGLRDSLFGDEELWSFLQVKHQKEELNHAGNQTETDCGDSPLLQPPVNQPHCDS